MFKVSCCLSTVRHAELHGDQDTPDNRRQVDEEDLWQLYAYAWKDHVPEEEEEEEEEEEKQPTARILTRSRVRASASMKGSSQCLLDSVT